MNDYLIFENFICNLQINSSCAVSGCLKCNCKSDKFYILHNGKQTRGIFTPYIIGKNLTIIAECQKCKTRIILYKKNEFSKELKYFSNKKRIIELSINFGINYFENKMYANGHLSNNYEYIIINGKSISKKYNAIIEK